MGFSPASITVDRTSPVPLYYQVAQRLEQAVESGELPPQDPETTAEQMKEIPLIEPNLDSLGEALEGTYSAQLVARV